MSVGTVASGALDEAFERMAFAGFELPNGFVNHGAMACEALTALGLEAELGVWARRFSRLGVAVVPTTTGLSDWKGALGDYRALPDWVGVLRRLDCPRRVAGGGTALGAAPGPRPFYGSFPRGDQGGARGAGDRGGRHLGPPS
jgi:hypothetical protein